MTFTCYDSDGASISSSLSSIDKAVVFINKDYNNLLIAGEIDTESSGGSFLIEEEIYLEGTYHIKIYFDSLIVYENKALAF
jgi:hypothetical protein